MFAGWRGHSKLTVVFLPVAVGSWAIARRYLLGDLLRQSRLHHCHHQRLRFLLVGLSRHLQLHSHHPLGLLGRPVNVRAQRAVLLAEGEVLQGVSL